MAKKKKSRCDAQQEFAEAVTKSLADKVKAKFAALLPVIIGIIEIVAKFCKEKTAAKLAAKIVMAKNPKKGENLRAQLREKVAAECDASDDDYSDDEVDAICTALIAQAAGPQKANVAVLNAE